MIRIEKLKFDKFFNDLRQAYTVFAPADDGRVTSFQEIDSVDKIAEDILNTRKSPKELFFPQTELLFSYDQDSITNPEIRKKPMALWGVRPCDARSFTMLDKVFGDAVQKPGDESFQDSFWKDKHDNALIFVKACNEPALTCFCNWFGSGPHSDKGADIFVVDAGDYYLMNPVTDKGIEFCEKVDAEKSESSDLKLVEELKKKAETALNDSVNLNCLDKKLATLWDDPVWDEVSAKCINCAACTYVCSTCHCFDIQDERKGGKGNRIRLWDSCMYPIFTKEASGHNPRGSSKDRVRQRVMHKFSYFVEKYNEFLCTGCGRCVQVCPVNFDIREVIKKMLLKN